MRQTIADQVYQLKTILNQKEDKFISDFMKDKERPEFIYRIIGWNGGIEKLKVEGLATDRWKMPLINKPTRAYVAELKEYVDSYNPEILYVEYKSGNGSGAYKWKSIEEDKNISFNEDDLKPILAEMIEKFAPREGYFACSYCRKQTPIENKVTEKIFGRGRKQVWNSWKKRHESKAYVTEQYLDFCSGTCAGNEQMSREG